MGQQQPIRVVVEKKPSGCWGVFGVMLLIGLAVEYWYVSLGILVLLVVVGAIAQSQQKKQKKLEQEKERHRPGPRDPWLNDVAVALADLGLVERARNTGAQVGGVPIDGDVGLDGERLSMFVTLFGTDELARQAELALRAKPEVRTAESNGHSMVKAQGRVLYTANGRGGVADRPGCRYQRQPPRSRRYHESVRRVVYPRAEGRPRLLAHPHYKFTHPARTACR